MQTQIRLLLIRVFSVCYSDKHICDSIPKNQHFIYNRKRKVFQIFQHLPYIKQILTCFKIIVTAWNGQLLWRPKNNIYESVHKILVLIKFMRAGKAQMSMCIHTVSPEQGWKFFPKSTCPIGRGFINFFGIQVSRQSRRVIWQYLPIDSIQIYQK